MECTNPKCMCQTIPKVTEEQHEDWTERSNAHAASFGAREPEYPVKPRCYWCETVDPEDHPPWHDQGTPA